MALPRRTFLASLGVAVAGCTTGDAPQTTDSTTRSAAPRGTDPGYANCDHGSATPEELHTAGGIPDPLTEKRIREYVKRLEKDTVLPPPEELTEGALYFGEVTVESVAYGYLATVEVAGGHQREDPPGTATGTHADLGQHIATYFINNQVVRRAKDWDTELDPREHGEVVVCESS